MCPQCVFPRLCRCWTSSTWGARSLHLRLATRQFVHEDAFTSEWLQWQVYVTDAGSATVGAVFSHAVFGEGDAAAVAYLRSLREKGSQDSEHAGWGQASCGHSP